MRRKWWLRRWAARWSDAIKTARGRMDTPARRALGIFESLFIDHAIFRAFYGNRHQVAPGAWRAAQLSPRQVAWAAGHGIRTIINLRGARDCASYILEAEACARHGVTLIDFPVNSRAAPPAETIVAAAALFDQVEHPVLFHCKSGADRAGFVSALYLLAHEGRPLVEAQAQLSWRFGHFRQSRTGVLDHVFDLFATQTANAPVPFLDWVRRDYDAEATTQSFRSLGWANTLVDGVLDRE